MKQFIFPPTNRVVNNILSEDYFGENSMLSAYFQSNHQKHIKCVYPLPKTTTAVTEILYCTEHKWLAENKILKYKTVEFSCRINQ